MRYWLMIALVVGACGEEDNVPKECTQCQDQLIFAFCGDDEVCNANVDCFRRCEDKPNRERGECQLQCQTTLGLDDQQVELLLFQMRGIASSGCSEECSLLIQAGPACLEAAEAMCARAQACNFDGQSWIHYGRGQQRLTYDECVVHYGLQCGAPLFDRARYLRCGESAYRGQCRKGALDVPLACYMLAPEEATATCDITLAGVLQRECQCFNDCDGFTTFSCNPPGFEPAFYLDCARATEALTCLDPQIRPDECRLPGTKEEEEPPEICDEGDDECCERGGICF